MKESQYMELVEYCPTYAHILELPALDGDYACVALEPLSECEPQSGAYDGLKVHYIYGKCTIIGFDFSLFCEVGKLHQCYFADWRSSAPITMFDAGQTYCERITHDDMALWPGLGEFTQPR